MSKKRRIDYESAKTRLQCQKLFKTYRRNIALLNRLILTTLLFVDKSLSYNIRLTWSFQKNGRWWSEVVPKMDLKQFKENFRIEKSTFSSLINQIGPYLAKLETNYRETIPVDKRIACALYMLGSSSETRTIAHLFGIGRSTMCQIFHEFCSVLVKNFFHRFVKFPSTQYEIRETIEGFDHRFGYPMCIGALDGTHIEIKAPAGHEVDYFNYKKFHSVIMLATVNADLAFTYVNVGAPGRCNDASVFNRCVLSEVIKDPAFDKNFVIINNTKVRCHLIADSAFGLNATVMKPFSETPNMPKNLSTFNYRLSRARCSVERAFGALKNRFRLLHKKLEFKLHNVTNIIKAAVVMHNLCIFNNDTNEMDWDIPLIVHKRPSCNAHTQKGSDVRYALVDFFSRNPLYNGN